MRKKKRTPLLLVVVISILFSCAENKRVHPKSKNIPFGDVKEVLPEGEFNIERKENIGKYNLDTLDIYLGEREDVIIKYLNKYDYLILDKNSYKLYKYDRSKNKLHVVNEESQGPKDLSWATDISVLDDSVYISKKDFEYMVYFCNNTCKHERTASIPYQGRSVSATKKGIFLTTQQPIRDKLKKDESMNGIIYNARTGSEPFGKGYKSGAWLVRDIMNDSFLEGMGRKNVLAFKYFPYVFVYNYKQIKYKVKVGNFIMPKFIYDRKSKRISVNKRRLSSKISYIKGYGKNKYFIAVKNINGSGETSVESLRIYSLNTRNKKLERIVKYTSEEGLDFHPILTYRNTFYYKSGRIYSKNEL